MMPSGDGLGQLWRWPLYSPRRFFTCIAAVLALIAVTNMVLGVTRPSAPLQAAPTNTPAAPTATPEDTGTPATQSPASPAPALPGESEPPATTPSVTPKPASARGAVLASSAALSFTREWANHARPAAQWLAAVSRYADPEFAAQLRSTDPANVPASKVTGRPTPVSVFFASASVEVPTDAGTMVVDLVSDGTSWRVVDIHPKQ
jgi:hypothetical protein